MVVGSYVTKLLKSFYYYLWFGCWGIYQRMQQQQQIFRGGSGKGMMDDDDDDDEAVPKVNMATIIPRMFPPCHEPLFTYICSLFFPLAIVPILL